jgi:hypothetical protein
LISTVAVGGLVLGGLSSAATEKITTNAELLNTAVTPQAVAPSAPLYSNLGTDAGAFLLNGGVSTSGTTRYTSMLCNRVTLSQPGPQQITAFSVVLHNENAAAFTPSATSILFYDDSGANGAPGVRLLHKAGFYYGGGNYSSVAIPANGTYQLNAAPFGYTAAYVPAQTASEVSKVWACVQFSGTSAQAAQLANLGLQKYANAPTAGSTEDLAFVSTVGVATPVDNPAGTLTVGTGAANVFGWELTTLGSNTLLDSYQVRSATGTVGTAGFALNPSTGVEKNFSGYAATIDAPPLASGTWNITGLVLYPSCTVGNYSSVQATVQIWNTFNGSTAADVFSNSAPIASTTLDLGAFNCTSATSVYQFPVRLPTPISIGHSGTLGVTVKYSADSGSGMVDGAFMEVIQNAPAASPLIAVGANASTGGTGWYKSASNRADLNFNGATDYVTGTRQHTVLRVYADMVAPTHVVTATSTGLGAGAGTISPASGDVYEGATATYTLTPAAGSHLVTVTGSCGGTLSGSTFVTAPITADCTVNAVFGAGTGTNGLYRSPMMNHSILANSDGSTLNFVSGAWDDTGPISGAWDLNFWASSGALRAWTVSTYSNKLVLNGANFAVLHAGDVVGPSSVFSAAGNTITPDAAWLAGADAYIGFQFACNGRLANPVSGVCYGYAHLTTTGTNGFPATLVDYVYDGDGNPVTVGTVVRSVTSSIGTGSGLIDPVGAKTVADGGTVTYTLWPDSGYSVGTIGGTCPAGTLTGNSYTTGAVTADCTVIANFTSDAATHTVTPSIGSGTGTITPATPQIVNDGETTSFTLAADSGFQIGTVTGTCGGNLAGNVYTTNAVTADCTVIANFTGGGTPTASITPASLSFSVAQNSTDDDALTVANTGGGTLTFSITEALAANRSNPVVSQTDASMTRSRSGRASVGVTPRSNPQLTATVVNEGFEDVAGMVSTGGWIRANHSSPLGASNWSQCGGTAIPPAFDGDPNSCALVNYNSTTGGTGTISNWLLTKEITFAPGTIGSFYTRTGTDAEYADRLEVRVCNSGDCSNFGTGATDVGNYTTLLLTINPNQLAGPDPSGVNGYPDSWTQFTIPNLPTSGTGRIAFRYFVTNGGPSGANSSIVGLDRVVVDTGSVPPTGCANPSDVPWLSVSPTSGSVGAGSDTPVTVSVDTNGLAVGSYSAHVCVATNDTANPTVDVPVSLTVTGGVITHVVTPSIGSGTGTITPSTPQTVNDGATTSFTLAAGSGFQIGTVTGTCGGTLNAGVFTTSAVTADCTVIANFTSTGGQNGIITSGPLNHAIAATTVGTSLNIVTSALDDGGPVSGDWDFNFWSSSNNLTLWKINSTNGGQYAVDGSGKAVVFQSGDTIGSSNTFSTGTGGSVAMAAGWLAGTDGYLGVKFNCNGRLTFPVSGVCYGYVHLQTTGTTGFPATILDTAFDGDGNAITISGGTPLNDPSAAVTPASLSFTVAANATATEQVNIANAAGSSALTYSIEAREASKAVLYPHTSRIDRTRLSKAGTSNPDRDAKLAQLQARTPSGLTLGGRRGGNAAPWSPQGSIQFQLDDGTYEDNIGWGDSQSNPTTENSAVWVNRYTATGALTVDSVSIMWPQDNAGTLVGKQVNIVAYYDADGDGDPTNAVRLGTDNLQTIASLDAFLTYTTNFSVPGAGDVYIGFFNTYANGTSTPLLHPAAIDQGSALGDSWLGASGSGDGDVNFAANEVVGTIGDLSGGQLDGNWMIRATGTGGGSGGACTGPVVNWLTATPSAGSVNGGANVDVTVKADPAAGSLAAGSYTGELCITTNDPTQALIAIPVSLTVTAAPVQACSGGSDQIFCDGFDGQETGDPNVVTGDINQPVTGNGDGSSFDFALGDFHPYSGSITTDDINLYTLGLPAISVYWYGDAVPPEFADLVGGVVATAGGTDFRVLQSGDTIGPDSPVSAASQGADMSAFEAGVDGYIGVAFYNEGTGAVNYGYLHVTTSAGGFPVQVLDYGYNSVGEAITIP